jgi:hypothetical protein
VPKAEGGASVRVGLLRMAWRGDASALDEPRSKAKGGSMEELVKLVSDKTGLSPEMSRTAVETVVGYLKAKLPAPIAGQIDGLIAGGSNLGQMGDLAKGIVGFFK